MEYGTDLGAFTRLEDKIRLLHEDLESERELRQRIEREKSDFMIQLMQLSERLEEAEGSSESQCEMNKKRDAELAKLRKLLEDVHLESEETAHHLRKKHQEVIQDFQEQLENSNKHKNKVEREKQKFQSEVYELLAQIETANKDKLTAQKTVEKFEFVNHELNIRIEEMTRSVNEITAQKVRVSSENIELSKEVQECKVQIDNINYVKSNLATQLEDTRRKLEDEERRRSTLEQQCHTLEMEVESFKVQLEEESEIRLDIERQLSKASGDASAWKSKYEAELQAHNDECEELRRKIAQKISEYEEQLEILLNKCSNLEKQKSRLQSEVEILIMDLEKATTHAQALEKRCIQLEKMNGDLKAKIDELVIHLETTQRDLRTRTAELQKLQHEFEKLRDQRDSLLRENKKLTDDLQDVKGQLGDAQRRLHEMDLEIKRLENEREELLAAYKESEVMRRQEEAKAQRLAAELAQTRHDYERKLAIKEEELESIRKQMQIEIEHLNQRLAEAESKLKSEVARLKKKYQVQITELEMSLDAANKFNLDLQKTIKKQSLQIIELQSHYDEIHRQLQQTVDQLGVSQRRCQTLTVELDDMRSSMEQAHRAKRVAEQMYEEANTKVNELTTINVNLIAAKGKLEGEFSTLMSDFDETQKELRIADERSNRAIIELKTTKDVLIEEQERLIKIESIKKSLEIEVHNLQVRIEEVETNALAGGKRVIAKLESRIRDVEIEFEEEKRRHSETQKVLRKKEHRVRELILQTEEDNKSVSMLNDSCEKLNEKVKMYRRQLNEQEGMTQQNLTRVRRFQRELETAEDRADSAESNLSMIRAKHRTWVTTSQVPGGTRTVFTSEEQTQY